LKIMLSAVHLRAMRHPTGRTSDGFGSATTRKRYPRGTPRASAAHAAALDKPALCL
jgi:hypothetical protein